MSVEKKKFDSNTIYIKTNVNEVLAETELIFKIKIKNKKKYLDFNLKYVDDNIIFSNFVIITNYSTINSKIVSNHKEFNFEENNDYEEEVSNYSLINNNLDVDLKNKNKISKTISEYQINLNEIKQGEYIIIKIYYIQFITSFDTSYYYKLINNLPDFRFEDEVAILNFEKIYYEIDLETKSRITRLIFKKPDKYFQIQRKYNFNFTKCFIILKCNYEHFHEKIFKVIFKTENMNKINIFTQYNPKFNETSYFIHFFYNPIYNFPLTNTQYPDENYNFSYTENYIKENYSIQSCFIFIIAIDETNNIYQFIKNICLVFLNFLPINSIFNIIGYKNKKKKHNLMEYNVENVKNEIKIIKENKNNIAKINLLDELENIFDYVPIYKKLKIPKNIIILTDGSIKDENQNLSCIDLNYMNFNLDVISIENNIKDLIFIQKLGRHFHNFYHIIKNENDTFRIMKSIIKKGLRTYSSNNKIHIINENIDENEEKIINQPMNKYYYNENSIPFSFIKKGKFNEKLKIDIYINENDIKLDLKNETNNILKNGDQLSKLIIDSYLNNPNLKITREKKNEISEKYQIIYKNTVLLGENKETKNTTSLGNLNIEKIKNEQFLEENSFFQDFEILETPSNEVNKNPKRFSNSFYLTNEEYKKLKENKNLNNSNGNVNIMKLITSQNFVYGYWEENEITKIIKNSYQRTYNILRNQFNINLTNYKELLLTFIILYFLEKEKAEFLNDLEYSILKAKNYLSNNRISYDTIKSQILEISV